MDDNDVRVRWKGGMFTGSSLLYCIIELDPSFIDHDIFQALEIRRAMTHGGRKGSETYKARDVTLRCGLGTRV